MGLLGGGALTAQAQVNVPQLPQAPNLPVPVPSLPAPRPAPVPAPPRIEVPSPPPVPAPEPVQRVAPAVGELVGGSSGGGSSGGPVSGVGEAVRGGVERVLGGGSGSAVGGSRGGASGSGAAASGAGAAGAGGASVGAGGVGARPGGRRGARGRNARRPARLRQRAAVRRTVERKRTRLVRRLRGCIDGLPRMQRATLILRYGVGPLRARSRREAARLLDVSRGRVRVLERRGLRALANLGDGAGCADSGVSRTTLVAVYDLLTDTSTAGREGLHAPLEAGILMASAATVALDDGEGAVAGTRESGGKREHASHGDKENGSSGAEEDGPVASAGPSIGDPFGLADPALDNPFLLVLLAIVVACMVSAGREIRRALR